MPMDCDTSGFLEEVEQAAHSVAIIGGALFADTDAKVSWNSGAVCFPHRDIHKKRAVVGAEVLASLSGSYGKHFSAYCKGRKRVVRQKIRLRCVNQSTRTLPSRGKPNERLRERCSMRTISRRREPYSIRYDPPSAKFLQAQLNQKPVKSSFRKIMIYCGVSNTLTLSIRRRYLILKNISKTAL